MKRILLAAIPVLTSMYVQAQTPGKIPMFDQPNTGSCNGPSNNNCVDSVIYQDASGNVGIGTTNPFRLLTIGPLFDPAFTIEPADVSPNAGYIRFGDQTGWRLHFGRSREFSAGPLNTGLTGVLMTIQDNGNIGIGTTSPVAKLDSVVSAPAESTLTAVRGYNQADGTWGGIGVHGYSVNGTGVLGRTDNFSFAGVEAQSYQASPRNLALRVEGRSFMSGKLRVDCLNLCTGADDVYSLSVWPATGNAKGLALHWDEFSSRRWKTNIQTLHGALEKVERLRGVSFDWTEKGGGHDIGLIAEEVGEVIPEVVSYEENGKDAMGLGYARLTAVLIEAVKEQQSQIRELRAEIQGLKTLEEVQVRSTRDWEPR